MVNVTKRQYPSYTQVWGLLIYFLLVFNIGEAATSASVAKENVPDWVVNRKVNIHFEADERKISEGYTYLLSDQQTHIEKKQRYFHYAMKYLTETGVQNGASINIYFDPSYQNLTIHSILLHRDGKIKSILKLSDFKVIQREDDLESRIYDGALTAFVSLPDIRKGDIVEYNYTITGFNPVFGDRYAEDYYTGYDEPLASIFYRIVADKKRKLYTKQFVSNYPLIQKNNGNETEYIWDFSLLNPHKKEEGTPAWFNQEGLIQVTDYASWKEVVDWALPLYALQKITSPALKEKINEIESMRNEADKILAALKFVQENVRYMGFEIGASSHKPNNINSISAKRFGDCKDKSILLVTMLNALGFKAYPNLVHSVKTEFLSECLPSPIRFNHVTVCVEFNNRVYWLDPTYSNQGGNLDQLQYPPYLKTLVIKPGVTGITQIQDKSWGKTNIHETFVIKHPDSAVILRVISTYEGLDADNIRNSFANESTENMEKSYLDFYKKLYKDVSVESKLTMNDDDEGNVVKVFEEYQINQMFKEDESGAKKFMSVYSHSVHNLIASPADYSRKTPYAINYPVDLNHTIEVKFYSAFPITAESVDKNNKYFSYHFSAINEGGNSIVTINYHLKTLAPHVTNTDIRTFKTDFDEALKYDTYNLFLNNDNTLIVEETETSEGGTNILMVVLVIIFIAASLFLVLHLYRYDRTPSIEAEYASDLNGWLYLIMIGLVITGGQAIYSLFDSVYYSQNIWTLMNDVTNPAYERFWGLIAITEVLFFILTAFFSGLLLVLCYKRRSSFPFLYVAFRVAILGFSLFEYIYILNVNTPDQSIENESKRLLAQNILGCAIWIPYILTSWQVKQIFAFTWDKSRELVHEVELTAPADMDEKKTSENKNPTD